MDDFMTENPNHAVIRFNAANVLEFTLDQEQQTFSGVLYNTLTGKRYGVIADLEELED